MAPKTSGKQLVAAVHAAPVFMNTDATIDKTIGLIGEAGDQNIKLLVFPELFVPGYPYFAMCYSPLDIVGAIAEYVDAAIEVPGPEIARVQVACKKAGVAVVLGISERLSGTRTIFITQVFIDADGSLLGIHRKIQPTYNERMVFGQGGGATLKVFDTSLGRVGGLCCWEHTINGSRQEMIMQGEQIHAAAWPSCAIVGSGPSIVSDVQIDAMSKTHALTAQCFVVAAGLTIDQPCLDWMEKHLGPQKNIVLGGGWSAVIHPLNHYLAGPHVGLEERFVTAEVDLNDIKLLKVWADGAGHYSRPEVIRHQVDRRPLWHDEGSPIPSPAPVPISDLDLEPTK